MKYSLPLLFQRRIASVLHVQTRSKNTVPWDATVEVFKTVLEPKDTDVVAEDGVLAYCG